MEKLYPAEIKKIKERARVEEMEREIDNIEKIFALSVKHLKQILLIS